MKFQAYLVNTINTFNRFRFSQDIYYVSLILIAMAMPFDRAATNVAIGSLISAWFIGINKDYFRIGNILTGQALLFVFFYGLYVIGMLYTSDWSKGMGRLETQLVLLIFPVVIGFGPKINHYRYQRILKGFVLGCFIAVVSSLLYGLYRMIFVHDILHGSRNWNAYTIEKFLQNNPGADLDWNYFAYNELSSFLDLPPAYFSLYLGFAVFIILTILIRHWKSWSFIKKGLGIFIIAIFTLFIVQLSSRGGILAFVATFYFYLFYAFLSRKWYKAFFGIIGIITIFLTFMFYYSPIVKYRMVQEIENQKFEISPTDEINNAVAMRIVNWTCSIRVIKDNLLFGVGTGDDKIYLNQCYQNYNMGVNSMYLNAHNQFLQVGLSLGLFGLTLFLLTLFSPVLIAIRNNNQLFIVFIWLFVFSCLTISLFESQNGTLFYAFFNSLMVFAARVSTSQ
ncbi:MAG: O-antigen ligase family protein [Bacteroidetes bacterium]|nr:O-antigen ligase family protein [Bacteroidota bacterium]